LQGSTIPTELTGNQYSAVKTSLPPRISERALVVVPGRTGQRFLAGGFYQWGLEGLGKELGGAVEFRETCSRRQSSNKPAAGGRVTRNLQQVVQPGW
jgi:hypothetical protein